MKIKFSSVLGLFVVALLLFATSAMARQAIDVTLEVTSDVKSRAGARQDMFKQAIEDMSMKYINDIVGAGKAEKNKELIENKILKNSGKYVLFIKGTNIKKATSGTTMTVNMKVSLENLRKMLLAEGLLYEMEGPPKVLPMVSFSDRVNASSFSWWAQKPDADRKFLVDQMRRFHRELKKSLKSKGFYGLSPIRRGLKNRIPETFKNQSPRTEDYLFIGEFFSSSIVLRGDFRVSKNKMGESYTIAVRLEALHSGNGRVIGEVVRNYETESGPFKLVVQKKMIEVDELLAGDLASQLLDAWKRGTFGASLLRLTLRGRMNYRQLDQLKSMILREVRGIKSLRERLFEPDRVTFEIDTSSNSHQLAAIFQKKKFPKYKVEVDDVRTDGLALYVKAW